MAESGRIRETVGEREKERGKRRKDWESAIEAQRWRE